MIFLAPLWPIGLQTVRMCCMLRVAALRLIGSLTLSDQLCGCVGVVLTGRVEGTDFRLIKRCLGTKKGLCRETPPYPRHCCVNMPTSKVAPAYLSVYETPAKSERERGTERVREPCVHAGEPARSVRKMFCSVRNVAINKLLCVNSLFDSRIHDLKSRSPQFCRNVTVESDIFCHILKKNTI